MNVQLKPWQTKSADALVKALRLHRSAADFSETGTGKTFTAMEVARRLGFAPVVVCPAAVCPAWREVAELFEGSCFPVSWQALAVGAKSASEFGRWVETPRGRPKWAWNREIPFIIFDEAHMAKNGKTKNAYLLRAAVEQRIPHLILTATPAESPLDLKAIGYSLRLHNWDDFWTFCTKNGCYKSMFGTLEWVRDPEKRIQGMKKLFSLCEGRFVRVCRDDPAVDFPDTLVTSELFELDTEATAEAAAAYEEMSRIERDAAMLGYAKVGDRILHPAQALNGLKAKIELLKVDLFQELTEQALSEGFSVAAFFNFTEPLEHFLSWAKLKGHAPARLDGHEKTQERFQSNETRVIACNIQAGGTGVSLHDTDGRFPRQVLINPTWSARDLVQVLGRCHRATQKSKSVQRIIHLAGTREMAVQKALVAKLSNISALTDGDLSPIATTLSQST